jgi:hypothetical protein
MNHRKKRKRQLPRYVSKMLYLAKLGAIRLDAGALTEIAIYHDYDCRHWQHPGQCNCDPDVKQRWVQHAGSEN